MHCKRWDSAEPAVCSSMAILSSAGGSLPCWAAAAMPRVYAKTAWQCFRYLQGSVGLNPLPAMARSQSSETRLQQWIQTHLLPCRPLKDCQVWALPLLPSRATTHLLLNMAIDDQTAARPATTIYSAYTAAYVCSPP